MLNEKQIRAAKEYAEGQKPTDIAKNVGVSRTTFYKWLENGEFTSEVDRYLQEIKTSAEKNMVGKVENYIRALEDIAFTGKSEKNRADALTYLLDRVLGRATTKVQDITEASDVKEDTITWEDSEDNNILELKTGNNGK